VGLRDRPATGIRALYVSPLKALCNDVYRTIRLTLRGIRRYLPESARRLRIVLRTGDATVEERRCLLTDPPDMLLTTPESLAVLLSQPAFIERITSLRYILVDEVHAFAESKRGADLSLSLERLTAFAQTTPQRIGLSATCTPLADAARFLVGVSRPCTIAHVPDTAPLHMSVELLEADGFFFSRLLDRLRVELSAHRSTLIFANTRRMAERLAFALRRRYPEWDEAIAVHHSALARDRRRAVERQFKRGWLRAVVSSTSLELGIDVGPVEYVVLVHPPGGVVRLLQRVGRGGHAPGGPRRGLILTAGPGALFEAVATVASGKSSQCERLRLPVHPLDVLCQHLLGMAAVQPWTADEAYALVRKAACYKNLPRRDFDDCLDYLAGRTRDGNVWFPVRLAAGSATLTWTVRDAKTVHGLRRSIGSILTEETRRVVVGEEIANRKLQIANCQLVGEVDAMFGDQLQPGDRFLLDGRCLELRRQVRQTLLVEEVFGRPPAPHWSGNGWALSSELAERLFLLRAQMAETLRDNPATFGQILLHDYGLPPAAVAQLAEYFEQQEALSEVPDGSSLLIETVRRDHGWEYYGHTPLNRSENDALMRVAVLRLMRRHGRRALSLVTDLGFLLVLLGKEDVTAEHWRTLLSAEEFETDLSLALDGSDILREQFRCVAQTGLLVPRNPRRQWVANRLCVVDSDFVLMRQARRELCHADAARDFVERLPRMRVRCRRLAELSPFAMSWGRTQPGMSGNEIAACG
jgi:ATP-dependent Lhr-like helicase